MPRRGMQKMASRLFFAGSLVDKVFGLPLPRLARVTSHRASVTPPRANRGGLKQEILGIYFPTLLPRRHPTDESYMSEEIA